MVKIKKEIIRIQGDRYTDLIRQSHTHTEVAPTHLRTYVHLFMYITKGKTGRQNYQIYLVSPVSFTKDK